MKKRLTALAEGGLPILAIGFASLWDFRFQGLRVFDFAALGCVLVLAAITPLPFQNWIDRRRHVLVLYAVIGVYAILGLVLQGHRSSLAIILFALVALQLHSTMQRRFGKAATWCAWLHIVFFAIQFIGYYGFGKLFDYHALLGQEPSRIVRSLTEIRAAGLFLEPNSYALNQFILTSLAVRHRRNWKVVFASALTMMLSQSLWGLAAAVALVLLHEFLYGKDLWRSLTRTAAASAIAFAIFNVYLWLTKAPVDSIPFFYARLKVLTSDPSFLGRIAGNACAGDINRPAMSYAFGDGLSTVFFLECLPANGFSFLFRCFGIIGLTALIAGLGLALRQLPPRTALFAAGSLIVAFTTYPIMTYLIFWLWLAALLPTERGTLAS